MREGIRAADRTSPWRQHEGRTAAAIFAGDGEMRALCRAHDWSSTPLGPAEGWSQSLRTTAGLVLASRNPMFLFWGPELVQIYNDAYRPSLGEGGRHPRALGMRGREFWTEIWDTIGPQIEQVMTGGPATWHEDQYLPIQRNGRLEDVWWTYSYSAVRDDDGSVGGTLVVCQETTGRVRAEQALRASAARYRALFESLDQGLCVIEVLFDDDGRPVDYRFMETNASFERQTGLVNPLGRTARELVPSLEEFWFDIYGRVARTGESHRFEHGSEPMGRYFDVFAFRIGDPDQRQVALIFTDVTQARQAAGERERLLQESERARREAEDARTDAERANRVKGEFLAVMSHELRTPLNAIGGYAELMQMGIRGPLTAQQREDLSRIHTSQRHLLGLINEVLNYAKLETGTVQYDIGDVAMRELLAAAEALVAPQARAKGLTLRVAECPDDLLVRADGEKLRQILVNLLSNAVKFTDRGGRITIACALSDGHVSVRVEDTGIGIAAERLDSIFEPFVQVRADLTRPHEGTGLGLAISRDLARGMGGELAAESTPGEGSTFTLRLPAAG